MIVGIANSDGQYQTAPDVAVNMDQHCLSRPLCQVIKINVGNF